ncbi:odorant receptor 67c-like [Rhodnius prolixus]
MIISIILKMFGGQTLEEFLNGVLFGVIILTVAIKQANLIIRRKQIFKLLDDIENCLTLARADLQLVEKRSLRLKKIGKLITIYILIATGTMFAFHYVHHELTGDKTLPVELWTPYSEEGTTFTVIIYQLIIDTGATIGLIVFSALLLTAITFSTMIMDVLKKNLAEGPDDEETLETFLSRYVLAHAKLLNIIKAINVNISPMLFIETVLSSIQCCCAGYLVNFRSFHGAMYTIHFVSTLTLPGLICYLGQLIKNKNEELFDQIYDSPWYTAIPNLRRYYLMMISMSSKPLILHFRFLMTFDLERYGNVLQAAYTYVTVLKNLLS